MPNLPPIRLLIKNLVTTGILSGLGFLLFKYRESFYILQDLTFLQIISFCTLVLFCIILSGSKLNQIASNFNIRLKKNEWLALSSMTTILNSIFFKSGSLATSTYLKKKIRIWIRLVCRVFRRRSTHYFIYSHSYREFFLYIFDLLWKYSTLLYIYHVSDCFYFFIYPSTWKNNFTEKKRWHFRTTKNRHRIFQHTISK